MYFKKILSFDGIFLILVVIRVFFFFERILDILEVQPFKVILMILVVICIF